ncbi:MAG: SusC/RagA family TonB-linked outer membrane protein [Sphingobacterium sp.]|uniref:SusC/RagA family TonB-linked outer membrane protein n=1 Tax=Sphingobacterium sp. JB170 TaxID=1434842 RepID=UPI00097EE4C8|nr:SusC/RagA family TonB-linked outer membrane protein [Sphingobacterium sp. JB170]SJN26647.1 hypothetical protein FM107_04995 [Sphingobacterium sp. JB170]
MKKISLWLSPILWGILVFIACYPNAVAYAQQSEKLLVKGQVRDNISKSPLPSVTIKVRGIALQSTNEQGYFSVRVSSTDTLVFTSTGYTSFRYPLHGETSVNIVLESNESALDEVVINANVNDVDIRYPTAAISVVKGADISYQPIADPLSALQGKVAGLRVIRSGELGAAPEVRIRGVSSLTRGNKANQPLYVLDGQIIDMDAFLTLNPQDIEEMKVLKDATANAMYGVKAANGVIEISTKRAKTGERTFFYNFQGGVTLRGSKGLELMDSEEKLAYEALTQNPAFPGYRFSEEGVRKEYGNASDIDQLIAVGQATLDSLKGIHTDWFQELMRRDYYQSHQVGMASGTDKTSFYVALNYTKQGGKIEGNNLQRYTGRFNMQHRPTDNFTLDLSVGGAYSETTTHSEGDVNPASLIYQLNPYETKSNALGQPTPLITSYRGERTYADLIGQADGSNRNTRGSATVTLRYEPWSAVHIDVSQGIDYVVNDGYMRIPPEAISQQDKGEGKGQLTTNKLSTVNYSSNARILWQKSYYKHDFTLTGNLDYLRTRHHNIGYTGFGLSSKITSAAGINQGLTGNLAPTLASGQETQAQLGFGGAFGYTWNKFLDAFFNYKRDGASILPSDKRWNTAWAAGVGVELSEISELQAIFHHPFRIRASMGNTAGLGAISPGYAVAIFTPTGQEAYLNGRGLALESMYNPDLVPEQSRSYNIGLDVSVWNGRVNLTADVYRRTNSQVLMEVPIQPSIGFQMMMRNVGVIRNQGIELAVSADVMRQGEFRWNFSANGAYNTNKVLDLYGKDKLWTNNNASTPPDYQVGKATDILWGVQSLGIHPIDGIPRYLGAGGIQYDGRRPIENEDFVAFGHTTPPFTGGMTQSFSYKNINLSFDFYYTLGAKKSISPLLARDAEDIRYAQVKGMLDQTWQQLGDEGKAFVNPRIVSSNTFLGSFIRDITTSRTVQQANYLRLSNVRLSCQFPETWLAHSKVVKTALARIQAQDLFVLSSYQGPDPESGTLAGSLQPVISFSLNLGF